MSKTLEKLAVFDGTTIQIQSLDDIWMSQKQMAEMFGKDVSVINRHVEAVKKELADWEELNSTVAKNAIVQIEGGREVKREVEVYGFEFICQVGYKVNSVAGMKFRQFATRAVMEKVNRDLLNRDDEINDLTIENEVLKGKLGEAVMEISQLKDEVEFQSQFVPDESEYGKPNSNGQRKLTFQKGGFKANNGRKVQLRPKYLQLDLLAINKYLTE